MGPGANIPSVPVEALSEEEQVCDLFSLSILSFVVSSAYPKLSLRLKRTLSMRLFVPNLVFKFLFFSIIQSFVFLCDIRLFTYLCFSLVLFALHRQKQNFCFCSFHTQPAFFPSFFRNSHEFDIFPSILFHRHEATSPRFPLHRACPCRQRLLQDSRS